MSTTFTPTQTKTSAGLERLTEASHAASASPSKSARVHTGGKALRGMYGPLPTLPATNIPIEHLARVTPDPMVLPRGVDAGQFRLPAALNGATSSVAYAGETPEAIPFLVQVHVVSPDQAAQWLDYFPFKYQRSIRASHASSITEVMRAGRFDQTTDIKFAHFDGKTHLINGQHRLHSVVESGVATRFVVTHVMCKSWEEIVSAYIREDLGINRTQRDALIASNVTQEIGIPLGFGQRMLSGINLINSGFRRDRKRRADREQSIGSFVTWKDEIHAYMNAMDGVHPLLHVPMLAAGVVSVALVTYRHRPKEAATFWPRAATYSGLLRGEAEDALVSSLLGPGRNDRRETDRQARCVASYWNMFVEKTPPVKTRTIKTDLPIRIAGTPYDGMKDAQ